MTAEGEDGWFLSLFETRQIAIRMVGRSWVCDRLSPLQIGFVLTESSSRTQSIAGLDDGILGYLDVHDILILQAIA